MNPRFLSCLPKHRLSMPSKLSLQVRMVIDNLTIVDVHFFLVWGFVFDSGLAFFHSRFLVIFKCLWILGLDVRSVLSVNGPKSWVAIKCCLSVAIGGIGILVTECWLKFNMCTLLRRFQISLVLPSEWLTFLLMKKLLVIESAILFRGH